MFSLSGILAAAKAAGLTGTTLTNFVQTVAGNSPTTAAKGIFTTMLANINEPTIVNDEAVKLGEIQNIPSGVEILIPELTAATTADGRIAIIRDMETALGE